MAKLLEFSMMLLRPVLTRASRLALTKVEPVIELMVETMVEMGVATKVEMKGEID